MRLYSVLSNLNIVYKICMKVIKNIYKNLQLCYTFYIKSKSKRGK